MKIIFFNLLLIISACLLAPCPALALGGYDGYWQKISQPGGAPNFLHIAADSMRKDRNRAVKISTVRCGDELLVREQTGKTNAYGLADNNFDSLYLVDPNTLLVTRPSSIAGQPALQAIYQRIGYEEAKKYLPPNPQRRARRK